MITNTGKSIIAKYLVGQAPAYASYIALGCGPTPLPSDGTLGDYSSKTSLDFEMFRVPITSRGFVNEDGVNKIVLTAELPTEERYEISEVGLYSAGSNPSAGAYDSKTVYIFNDSEGWEYHPIDSTPSSIPSIFVPLAGEDNIMPGEYKLNANREYDVNGTLTPLSVFKTSADNRTFTTEKRIQRYERSRFLNSVIMIQGDNANLSVETVGGIRRLKVENNSNHIHLTGANLDFSKNAPSDELKLAFSVVSKVGGTATTALPSTPDRVRVLVEFGSSDIHGAGQWARFEADVDDVGLTAVAPATLSTTKQDFTNNRYVVVTKQLQDLRKSSGFTWGDVDTVKIYVSIQKETTPGVFVVDNAHYVALDAFRLDNKSQANPLYGLTGYSVIRNTGSKTIVKDANTTNYVEFRFGMDVV